MEKVAITTNNNNKNSSDSTEQLKTTIAKVNSTTATPPTTTTITTRTAINANTLQCCKDLPLAMIACAGIYISKEKESRNNTEEILLLNIVLLS